MREKRKRMTMEDIKAELQDIKAAEDQKREEEAHRTLQRVAQKIGSGRYQVTGPNTIRVRLWFSHFWWEDRQWFEHLAQSQYGLKLSTHYQSWPDMYQQFTIEVG